MYCLPWSTDHALLTMLCPPRSAHHALRTKHFAPWPAYLALPSTNHAIPVMHYPPCTAHHALCTIHYVLSTEHHAFRSMNCQPCTTHHTLPAKHCQACTTRSSPAPPPPHFAPKILYSIYRGAGNHRNCSIHMERACMHYPLTNISRQGTLNIKCLWTQAPYFFCGHCIHLWSVFEAARVLVISRLVLCASQPICGEPLQLWMHLLNRYLCMIIALFHSIL